MTIKQYAEEKGISPQAVYQRLKKNKVKVESITEKLFSTENRQIKPIKDEKIEALEKQLSEARAQLSSKDELIKSLEKERDSLKEDKDYFKQALNQAQTNLSDIKALLPGPVAAASSEKLTWKERITGRRLKPKA